MGGEGDFVVCGINETTSTKNSTGSDELDLT